MSIPNIEFAQWRDPAGMVSPFPDRNEITGNGLLYTAEAMISLKEMGLLTEQEIKDYIALMATCKVPGYEGLYNRSPLFLTQESIDDYSGLCAGYHLVGYYEGVEAILDYGKKNWFNYNNINPGKITASSWLIRFPQLIAQMYMCANKRVPFFLACYYILERLFTTYVSIRKGNRIHDFVLVGLMKSYSARSYNKSSRIMNWLIQKTSYLFNKRVLQFYPEGYGQAFGDYCKIYEHPLTKYLPKSI